MCSVKLCDFCNDTDPETGLIGDFGNGICPRCVCLVEKRERCNNIFLALMKNFLRDCRAQTPAANEKPGKLQSSYMSGP